MKLLLDTHVLLWWFFGDPRISEVVQSHIKNPGNDVFVSSASAWEISTKHRLGKLPEAAGAVERLPAQYHGSGCTLAAACAATLAHGVGLPEGINRALDYTWQSLKHGYRLGMGQYLPNRLYWTDASTIAPTKKHR